MQEISSLEIVAGAWQAQTTTWDRILHRNNRPQGELLFTSLRAIASAPDILRGQILNKFGIAPFLLNRVYLESNGFSGCEPVLDDDGNLEHYNYWSRFLIKQVYERLRPKRSFTRHHATSPKLASPSVPIHSSRSIPHGWEWYEMGFFVHWTPPSSTTILCFDLPQHFQILVKSAFTSRTDNINFSDPYSVFDVLLHELLSLYDNSVWSIRNHICGWEAARPPEPDYSLLHEIARHAIHVSETLTVTSGSIKELQQQRRDFMMLHDQSKSPWRRNYSPFQFPLRVLDGLLSRSESNKARLQNEIQLAFHNAAQRDSRIQVRIGEEAKREATAMKTIAVITMIFLPPTFVSSVFSTPFFYSEAASDGGRDTFIVSNQFWIYWALAAPSSVLTLTLWIFWDAVRDNSKGHRSKLLKVFYGAETEPLRVVQNDTSMAN